MIPLASRSVAISTALSFSLCLASCSFASLGRVTVDGRDADTAKLEQITIEREGKPLPVTAHMTLEEGDVVATGPDVAVLIEFAGASALLMPNTKVTLGSIFTWFGEVFLSGWLAGKTQLGTAGTEGTEYVLRVDGKTQETIVTVLEGHVRVSPTQASWPALRLTRGQRISIVQDGATQPAVLSVDRSEYNALIGVSNRARGDFQDPLVPDVRDLPREEAERLLAELGLRVEARDQPVADVAQIGRVVAQAPKPGERSRKVTLKIGVTPVVVPQLTGMSLQDGERALQSVGLRLGNVKRKRDSAGAAPDTVLSQRPETGALVAPGSKVRVVVQAPAEATLQPPELVPGLDEPQPQPVLVPDVVAQSPDAARGALQAVGLSIVIEDVLSEAATSIAVSEQEPIAGSEVAPGSSVRLRVAHPAVRVPDLLRARGPTVGSQAKRAGLTLNRSENWVASGADQRVLSQTPDPGTLVERGSAVSVVVERVIRFCGVPALSDALAEPEVPPATGTREEQVKARVEEIVNGAGLTAQVTVEKDRGRWFVRRQQPESHTRVDCRTVVMVEIGSDEPIP